MANGRTTTPTLGAPSVSDVEKAFSFFRGQQFAGVTDISALDPREKLKKSGRRKLEEAGRSLDQPFDLVEARDLGLTAKDFVKTTRKDLQGAGLTQRSGKDLADQAFLERFRFGSADVLDETPIGEQAARSLDLITRGLDVTERGLAIQTGDLSDPLARQVLENVNELVGSTFGTRGLSGQSGVAALSKTALGLDALTSFGSGLVQSGLSVAQGSLGIGGALNPFSFPEFSLGREDLGFERRLFADLTRRQLARIDRAQDIASSPSEIFKSSLVASAGQNLPGILNLGAVQTPQGRSGFVGLNL